MHSLKDDDTIDLLLQTTFSSSLVHLTAHPTSLFRYLSKEYMILPPPLTPDVKFWAVFMSFSERTHEVERLSFGPAGEGSGYNGEMVVEILTRGINTRSRKRGTERRLEGWKSTENSPCAVSDLQDLKPLFSREHATEVFIRRAYSLPGY